MNMNSVVVFHVNSKSTTTKYCPPHMRTTGSNTESKGNQTTKYRLSHTRTIELHSELKSNQTTKYRPPHKRIIMSHSELKTDKFYAGSPIFSTSPSPACVPLPSYIIRKIVTRGAPYPVQD
ncbi:hypothetical protein QL285_001064 [Trifolium repens]|nr:hypothetical protein QL285_001064 [Trifolium repens]